jgi:hypothetical protein
MVTFQIQRQFACDTDEWHTIWTAPGDRTTIQELVNTLAVYRKNNPDNCYRLIKFEVIG